jgi:ribosomal protein S1
MLKDILIVLNFVKIKIIIFIKINKMIKEKIQTEEDVDIFKQLEVQHNKRKNKNHLTTCKEYETYFKLITNQEFKNPVIGEKVTGSYSGISGEQFTFTVNGFKDEVRIDNKVSESKYLKNTNKGDKLDILITEIDRKNYLVKGSIASVYESIAHLNLLNKDMVLNCFVRSMNPAGYEIDVKYDSVVLPGFMPNTLAGVNKLHNPESIVGKELPMMVESFSKDEGTYIVSRRKYLKTLIPDEMDKLEYGKIYEGVVTGTTDFGIFVEFNECLTGMIHKANIAEDWQNRLQDIIPGMEVNFYVKEIIKNKIILTQILKETLWDTIQRGQVFDAKVIDHKQFGILVSIDDETMGLITTNNIPDTNKVYSKGNDIKVKVINADKSNRKIFLSLV